ncbi:Acetyltransferase (GNAT) family protein [Agrococcus baldri]|uniref:Acetyltransferase (GNAT) family protein n=1 Tax=Agrococcus baldri TaxID=153730 RepID=A0AA94HPV0_9MICO|nr:GNAT family N-acetyltransferase [Agrococcus baldri]SFS19386.1 Acetyltransferase (GNAT) family protein [Agrococcus baldri]
MSATAVIRPFAEQDREALLALFARAGEGAPGGALWGHVPSVRDIYLTDYLDREPGSVLVAELGGRLVGYLAGSLDTASFPNEEERLVQAIRRHRLWLRPRFVVFALRGRLATITARLRGESADLAELIDPRWPAHLHIDVAPEARGTGAADELMRGWLAHLDAAGVPGCFLQTVAENTRAVRFFERMGFRAHGARPPLPGRVGGRRMHQLTMVHPGAVTPQAP